MKYPAVLGVEDVLPMLDQFDTIIDARSESEFALDRIPGAINCPTLNDAQRVLVGTTYKQVGAFEAKKIGAPLVARNIAHYVDTLFADKPKDWKPLVYCWRGGGRSDSLTHVLRQVGWDAVRLEGGYKAFRKQVVADLETLPARFAVARLRLPPGRHHVVLDARGWQRTQEIVVTPGSWQVVSLMALR